MKNIFNKTVISLIVISMVLGVILASAILITNNNKVPTMVSSVMSTDLGVELANANETNDEISTFSFGMTSQHYVAGNKTVYVRIDARETIFGDDVVLDYSCNISLKIYFYVEYKLNGNNLKTKSWTHTGKKGGIILNSGKTETDQIIVYFTIDGSYEYSEEFLSF